MRIFTFISTLVLAIGVAAQQPVSVGSGSYASFPPTAVGRTDAHGGDQSTAMQTRHLWVTERPDQPIPTNDWWTGLLAARFADALWSYPAMVHPSASGVAVEYPSHWSANGTEVMRDSRIEVQARRTDAPRGASDRFVADAAIAHTWHDWDVEMLMPDKQGTSSMLVTLVHGQPFTWVELTPGLAPRIVLDRAPAAIDIRGNMLSATLGADCYGIYLPSGASATLSGNAIEVTLASAASYAVVALLPEAQALEQFAEYAYNVPRLTRVDWHYDTLSSTISSCWTVTTESLLTGGSGGPVLQGFLPHQYKGATEAPDFTADTYLTPRGTMRMAEGTSFTFAHTFSGMLPWWPAPAADASKANPYRPEVMASLLSRYATQGTMGDDTYWGGKGLLQMAQCMAFALETGDTATFAIARDKLRRKLIDWLTYTPGETNVFFARYPRWGGLVGEATSYDSDTFNDHHFHYGYFTLAGAMLCLVDDDFRLRYGPMLREVAKDYANWERSDTRYPFLRTLDPWVGHSYAGGLGDQGNSNGNGQESSSESMQAWGGLYLLGVALGDDAMRDAGIFGWMTEARATREYWFDVDARFDRHGLGGNYDHTLFTQPYNTNITCKGIGWWTWFSGDPLHMHGIQWLPVSPALDYLSWDRDFVAWAYRDLMNTPGWSHSWFEDGTDPAGGRLGMLANDDWGNVTLAYMQRAFPDEAAAIFDTALERNLGIATAISTGHISYYLIHSHRSYGNIDFTVHADIPTAAMMTDPATGRATYVVFNPGDERVVTFYRGRQALRSLRAPKGKLVAVSDVPQATALKINSEEGGFRTLSTLQLTATMLDQYGASMPGEAVEWRANRGSISSAGLLNVASLPRGTTVTVTATSSGLSVTAEVVVSAPPQAASIAISPAIDLVEKGTPVEFSASVLDQYGEPMEAPVSWKIDNMQVDAPQVAADRSGSYAIVAEAAGLKATHTLLVAPSLSDLAQGRPGASSSEENAGSLTSGAFDGNASTRWGSAHSDGQWIAVDLGADYRLTSVVLNWEAAYASDYVIETAPADAPLTAHSGPGALKRIPAEEAWSVAAEVTGRQSAGIASVGIDARARYVRMRALRRATVYGVSLFAMEVHGLPTNSGAGYCLGIDIDAPSLIINENETLQLTATAWYADGSHAPAANPAWSADRGTVTATGVFTPAGYGPATVTATDADGRHTAHAVVNALEVEKAATLQVEISPTAIVGEPVGFTLECLNQFGGIHAPTETPQVTCNTPGAIDVDLKRSEITFRQPGNYTLTFSIDGVGASYAVAANRLSDFNLALTAFVDAPSGENPGLAADGKPDTRWQARPEGEQSITFELDDLYAVTRVATVWEAALATEWHVEVSVDGVAWCAVASNASTPVAGVPDTVDFNPVAARMVRIVADRLSDAAASYGMSLFEVEIYAAERIGHTADTAAPVISSFSATGSDGAINAQVTASDDGGYLTYTLAARARYDEWPMRTASATGATGQPVALSISGLRKSTYTCTLTVTDVAGNSATAVAEVDVDDPPLEGVNLALNRPATASSAENGGLGAAKAVDGDDSSRWGSAFADGQWLAVDLGDLYSLERVEILVLDAAYASEALLEYSVDGEDWLTLAIILRSGIGEETVYVERPVTARYVRYTGVKRATPYGVSVNELRVFGRFAPSGLAPEEVAPSAPGSLQPDNGCGDAPLPVYTPDGRYIGTTATPLPSTLLITPAGAILPRR